LLYYPPSHSKYNLSCYLAHGYRSGTVLSA
jgi:hypothetical protein